MFLFFVAGAARTTARLDGGEWVLDGTKAWITNAHDAQSSIVFATTDSSKKHKWVGVVYNKYDVVRLGIFCVGG